MSMVMPTHFTVFPVHFVTGKKSKAFKLRYAMLFLLPDCGTLYFAVLCTWWVISPLRNKERRWLANREHTCTKGRGEHVKMKETRELRARRERIGGESREKVVLFLNHACLTLSWTGGSSLLQWHSAITKKGQKKLASTSARSAV